MIFTAAFAAGLALLEYFFYFYSNSHFFQGDSILYFNLRYRSVQEFLLGFIHLDPAGWYRPLTARTVQSLLYPFFGFEPFPYRVVHYVLLLSTSVAIYKLALIMTRRKSAAALGTLFFAVHTVNGWVSYDVLFTPEVVFTLLYVSASAAYLRYRQSEHGRLRLISVLCFVGSLASKETALTLPVMLVVLDVAVNRTRVADALKAARVHFAVLAIYVVLIIGYLGVQRPAFTSILKRPGPEVSYRFALDRTIATNADYALTWAFNLPRGWMTESRELRGWPIRFLKFFRLATIALGLWVLIRPERRLMIAGVLWFLIAVSPALPLFEHFLPYYLFMPLVGFSIAVGTIIDAAYRGAARFNPHFAAIAIAVPLVVLAGICAVCARRDMANNRLLGISARIAENSLKDVKKAHPTLQPNTTIYISDAEEPSLSWDTSQGAIFKMGYNDETLQTLYWAWDQIITQGVLDRGALVVMKYHQFHLTDVTGEFLARSEPFVSYVSPRENRLDVTPDSVMPGQSYSVAVSGASNVDVTLHYTFNGSPIRALAARLDERGETTVHVSDGYEKGLYKFVGFNLSGSNEWFQALEILRIE